MTYDDIRNKLIIEYSFLDDFTLQDIKDTLRTHIMSDEIVQATKRFQDNEVKPDLELFGYMDISSHRAKFYYNKKKYELVIEYYPNRKLSACGVKTYKYNYIKDLSKSEFYEIIKNDMANVLYYENTKIKYEN